MASDALWIVNLECIVKGYQLSKNAALTSRMANFSRV